MFDPAHSHPDRLPYKGSVAKCSQWGWSWAVGQATNSSISPWGGGGGGWMDGWSPRPVGQHLASGARPTLCSGSGGRDNPTEVGLGSLRLGPNEEEKPLGPKSGQRSRPGGSQWVWDEAAESRGIRSPQAFIVRLSHFLWLYCFCPAPYCLVSFCPGFQPRCLLFSSQPGCFHFFCLKFLRGRFYFQRFD